MVFENYGVEIEKMNMKAKTCMSEFAAAFNEIVKELDNTIVDETGLDKKIMHELENIKKDFDQRMGELENYFVKLNTAYKECLSQKGDK